MEVVSLNDSAELQYLNVFPHKTLVVVWSVHVHNENQSSINPSDFVCALHRLKTIKTRRSEEITEETLSVHLIRSQRGNTESG